MKLIYFILLVYGLVFIIGNNTYSYNPEYALQYAIASQNEFDATKEQMPYNDGETELYGHDGKPVKLWTFTRNVELKDYG